jgi:hypothetical protein
VSKGETKTAEKCWAASLGDCDGKISREHLISECFWDGEKSVFVQGLHWCLNEPKLIGVANNTGKILCEKHNNLFGEAGGVDEVAGSARSLIERAVELNNVRIKLRSRHYNRLHFRINGLMLERWFLKTLINLSHADPINIWAGNRADRIPADELVRIAFGLTAWPEHSGLWLAVGQAGTQYDISRRLRFRSKTDGESLVGSFFSFCGYEFYLNLQAVHPNFVDFNALQTMHHIRKYCYTIPDDKNRQVLSHTIHLDW